MPHITAIIVAAGSGSRMGGVINKVFLPLGGRTVIDRTVETLAGCNRIDDIILVVRECDILEAKEHIQCTKKRIKIIKGGKTRQESVYLGLLEAKNADYVVIHDGARALVTTELVDMSIEETFRYGACGIGVKCKDTLKTIDNNGFISATVDREKTILIQTPQNFKYDEILAAHIRAIEDGFEATDDCMLYEKYIGRVKLAEGSYENIKLTTPEDMVIAERILNNRGESI